MTHKLFSISYESFFINQINFNNQLFFYRIKKYTQSFNNWANAILQEISFPFYFILKKLNNSNRILVSIID